MPNDTGLLVSLEDLFRAVAERRGHPVLRVSRQESGVVKLELAVLDGTAGNLLSPDAMSQVFGDERPQLGTAFAAMKAFRDAVFHGRLSEISAHGFAFAHLAAKLLFALSASIDPESIPAPPEGLGSLSTS
ncbi:MAG: hypothetical protein R3B13_27415 [Polyangiaceae bacterium]